MSDTIQGKLAVVAKTAGIKLNIGGVDTKWINPTKEAKDNILSMLEDLKKNIGSEVEVTRAEDNVYSSIKILDEIDKKKKHPTAEKVPTNTFEGVTPESPKDESGVPEKPQESEKVENVETHLRDHIMGGFGFREQVWDKKYFDVLKKTQCPTEKKNNLTYISWANAWESLKKLYPDAMYEVHENKSGMPYFCDTTGAFVKVGVTVCGLTHTVHLPVMDYMNKSIPLEKMTTFDTNKAIQRALAKAIAMHGLGLYVYRSEDLPEESK